MEPIIKAKNISKTYGDLPILNGINLEIKKGEIVAIIGPSGAGKTTLLQILGTLLSPDKNTETSLLIDGEEILGLQPKPLAKFRNQSIGFIFQFHELLDEFTALENVMMPGLIQGKKQTEIIESAQDLLDLLEVGHRKNHKPMTLSGGEQQRVAVARALINQPAIIFADEPSGNLDSHNADQLHHLFFKLRDELGHTFVIVTHNKELADMADRTVKLVDGRVAE